LPHSRSANLISVPIFEVARARQGDSFAQRNPHMNPVATEDSALDTPPRSIWRALRDLAISTIVVTAIALIVGFISA
jgi:hypothetical protein